MFYYFAIRTIVVNLAYIIADVIILITVPHYNKYLQIFL